MQPFTAGDIDTCQATCKEDFIFVLQASRGCINKNMVCGMGPYAGVDFISPYLIVNSVVSYPPSTQMGKGWSGELVPITVLYHKRRDFIIL